MSRMSRMSRTTFTLAALTGTLALALASGCQRNGDAAGTTTIRSGTPDGVRVTSAPDPASTEKTRVTSRLAAAVCAHERRCAIEEGAGLSSEAALLGEAVCVADLEPRARQNVEAWRCAPAVARAGFEECVAAIKTETKCSEISLSEDSEVRECRPSEICRKGAGIAGL